MAFLEVLTRYETVVEDHPPQCGHPLESAGQPDWLMEWAATEGDAQTWDRVQVFWPKLRPWGIVFGSNQALTRDPV